MTIEQLVFLGRDIMVITMPGELIENNTAHDVIAVPGMNLLYPFVSAGGKLFSKKPVMFNIVDSFQQQETDYGTKDGETDNLNSKYGPEQQEVSCLKKTEPEHIVF